MARVKNVKRLSFYGKDDDGLTVGDIREFAEAFNGVDELEELSVTWSEAGFFIEGVMGSSARNIPHE